MQVAVAQRPWFNPDFNGRWFFVPGLIATITLVMLVNLTAFAVVREREVGTLEQIMVSPIQPAEFILGKTVPFFVVGLGLAGLITIVGILWFHDSVRRQSARLHIRHDGISFKSARPRTVDLHDLLDPATGVRDEFLRR